MAFAGPCEVPEMVSSVSNFSSVSKFSEVDPLIQGCINCAILLSRIGARGVSSEQQAHQCPWRV